MEKILGQRLEDAREAVEDLEEELGGGKERAEAPERRAAELVQTGKRTKKN